MQTLLWAAAGVIALIAVAALVELWWTRNRYHPLSSHHPAPQHPEDDDAPPLGYEATDLAALRRTLKFNDRLAGQSGADSVTFAGLKSPDRPPCAGPRRTK